MGKRYTNIALPSDLALHIEQIIKIGELGYKTKSEFVKEAVRERLIEISKFEKTKRGTLISNSFSSNQEFNK